MNGICPETLGGGAVVAYAVVGPENFQTENTKQIVGGRVMGSATAMVIVQYENDQNFYLLGVYGDEWQSETDTWHQKIEDAIHQMDHEYKELSRNLVWKDRFRHLADQ